MPKQKELAVQNVRVIYARHVEMLGLQKLNAYHVYYHIIMIKYRKMGRV